MQLGSTDRIRIVVKLGDNYEAGTHKNLLEEAQRAERRVGPCPSPVLSLPCTQLCGVQHCERPLVDG